MNETLFTSTCADVLQDVLTPYVSTSENVEAGAAIFDLSRRRRLQTQPISPDGGVSVTATVGLESYDQYFTLLEAYNADTVGAEVRARIPEAVNTVFNVSDFSLDETATTSTLDVEGGAYTITTTNTSLYKDEWTHFVWPIFAISGLCTFIALIWASGLHSRTEVLERLDVDDEKRWVVLSYWLHAIDFWSDIFFVIHLDVLHRDESDDINRDHLRVLFLCALTFLVCFERLEML